MNLWIIEPLMSFMLKIGENSNDAGSNNALNISLFFVLTTGRSSEFGQR